MVGKFEKEKPWDDDPTIDKWNVEKFDPSWNEGGMLDVTSFSTLFPEYRGLYYPAPFFLPLPSAGVVVWLLRKCG